MKAETMTTKTTKQDESKVLVKPYTWYWHPHKSWTDMLFGLVCFILFPLHHLAKLPASRTSDETKKKNETLRGFLRKGSVMNEKQLIPKWEVASKCSIWQYTYAIPRKALLNEWGLYKESLENKTPNGDIQVLIRFPSSIVEPCDIKAPVEKGESPCVIVDNLALQKIPKHVPFVLHFFGGGMTIGAPSDAEGLQMAHEVCEVASKPIVFAGVCYSQSPEHAFPVAVEEGLIVVSYFLDKLPDRQIHISGISAGANLASIVTMEMHRRNPGRIASSSLICPMLNPAANTLSYYLNQNSLFISTEWLRWCWRCYLELQEPMEQGDLMQLETMKDRLNHGSNCNAWDESPYSKGVLARLVNPTSDMPTGLGKPEAPKFLVLTNEGDPLRDDGIDLVEKLKASGANLKHLAHSGSHWFGTALDKGSFKELVSTWKEVLFSE